MDFVKLNIHMNFSQDKVSKIIHLGVLVRTRPRGLFPYGMDHTGLDPRVQESNCYQEINVMIWQIIQFQKLWTNTAMTVVDRFLLLYENPYT